MRKAAIMHGRSFQMYIMPSITNPDLHVINGSIVLTEDGETRSVYQMFRSTVEIDRNWLDDAPDDQYAWIALELLSQVISQNAPPEVLASMRKAVAKVVDTAEIL